MTDEAKRWDCLTEGSEEVRAGQGRNRIPPPEQEPLWKGFLRKFQDPLMVVLLVVFVFSVAVSVYEILYAGRSLSALMEPAGVLAALLLATGVGFLFEVRAEREFRILNRKKDERPVKVLRRRPGEVRPQTRLVAKRDVCVGDVVRLENGDEVPADARLLQARAMHVDESAFTGEMFTAKYVGCSDGHDDSRHGEAEEAYPHDLLLRGSTVIEGSAYCRITAVGTDTEEGRGAMLLRQETEVQTPLNRQLERLSMWITRASYIVAALIVAGRMLYYLLLDGDTTNNTDWLAMTEFALDSVLIAVTLIVVAVPEGLPMSVTISLALSMRKMLKENNLVRRLHACETMGAATVICTDKTGTLTQNRLTVTEACFYGTAEETALSIAANTTAERTREADGTRHTVGNPTEGALLEWLARQGTEDYAALRERMTVEEQQAFSPETKYMQTRCRDGADERRYRFVKGAPEIVLAMCDGVHEGHSREEVELALKELQRTGRRTLAFALQRDEGPLLFTGYVGMADPVRADVPAAIATCRQAGVRVIMVTGDVALTANEVARETGIMAADEADQMLTGSDFAAMTDETLKRVVLPRLKVLSRARPTDKLRLVTLLQEMGEVVSVTGDGTNDALALKKAQVGLSMGDGTARAKEASDITIIDNSFVSINKAILWGRSLYRNIQRFLLFQMTINISACLIVLFGAFTGLESPLTVTQMLWVNLIMDTFAAMALSSLPPDPTVMRERPRSPQSHIIDRAMAVRIGSVGLLLFVVLVALWMFLHTSGQRLTPKELGIFFTTFVMLQFWNLFNARYFRTSRSLLTDLFQKEKAPNERAFSRGFLCIAGAIFLGQVLIVNVAYGMFNVAPLTLAQWLRIIVLTSPVLLVADGARTWQLRRRSKRG